MTDKQSFVLPAAHDRTEAIGKLMRYLYSLPTNHKWRVEVGPFAKRSSDQNALLWSLYEEVLRQGGETLGGWSKEDLHTYLLGEHFGWEVTEAFGAKRQRPIKRSSGLSKAEFSDYVDFVVRRMAEHGIVLELPGEIAA